MSKFQLTKSVNGHPVGTVLTVFDRHDHLFAKYGNKVELESAPENKAVQSVQKKKREGK